MLVVHSFPIMKHYRIVMTTGGQNNFVFDCKFYVCLFVHCDPTQKTQQLESRNRTGRGKKRKERQSEPQSRASFHV